MKNKKTNLTKEFLLYEITPFDFHGHKFKVILHIPKFSDERKYVYMPNWIPGSYVVRNFSKNIEKINAYSKDIEINLSKVDNHTWNIQECDEPIKIEYIVYSYDESVRGSFLDEERAFFNGSSVFLCVENLEKLPCFVKITLSDACINKNWKIYTSLIETDEKIKNIYIDNNYKLYMTECYDSLIDCPVIMGDFISCTFVSYGTIHQIVFSGITYNLDINRISTDIKRICDEQISFFEPISNTSPFIDSGNIFTFIINVCISNYGGLEHRSSTVINIPRNYLPNNSIKNDLEEYYDFLSLISHEYFHSWHVKRIKPDRFTEYNLRKPVVTNLLWIFEGFTSYYENIFLLRIGLIDENYYIKILNKIVKNVITRPGNHKQTLEESSFDAWIKYYDQNENSINSTVSYYEKGALAAFGLDTEIRKQTREKYSLDDVMRFLWKKFGEKFYKGEKKGLSEDGITAVVEASTGVNIGSFICNYIKDTKDMPIKEWLKYHNLRLDCLIDESPSLHVNTIFQENVVRVKSVIEGGTAHKAGIYSGDSIIAIDNLRINSNKDLIKKLKMYKMNDTVKIHLFRSNKLLCVSVPLTETTKIYEIKKI